MDQGIKRSTPEPDRARFDSDEEFEQAWQAWDADWHAIVAAHDAYRCEDEQREQRRRVN